MRELIGRAWRSQVPTDDGQDRERLEGRLEEVSAEVDALRAQVRELGEIRRARLEPAAAGASRCLPGQETRKGDLWRGVL